MPIPKLLIFDHIYDPASLGVINLYPLKVASIKK